MKTLGWSGLRGMTLVELMIVVIVIATLSAVSIPIYTNHIRSQRLLEAYSTMSIIRIAEENFASNHPPDGCYQALGANPNVVPGKSARDFTAVANWGSGAGELNILASLDGQSHFQYTVTVGGGASCAAAVPSYAAICGGNAPALGSWFDAARPWYVITAESNMDNNAGTANTFVITSKSRNTYLVCNEGS